MTMQKCLELIAQGAINISEGFPVIEKDSPIHRAMLQICDMAYNGIMPDEMPPLDRTAAIAKAEGTQ